MTGFIIKAVLIILVIQFILAIIMAMKETRK